jgi:hypothetical protein
MEQADKAYNEFMIEQERLHKIKYLEQIEAENKPLTIKMTSYNAEV